MNPKGILKTPYARYCVHVAVAFCAAFFPLEYAANMHTSRAVFYGAIAAAARAALGLTTSTNPSVGKNIV